MSVAVLSKTQAYKLSICGIVVSNPDENLDVRLFCYVSVV
jgi:hypothetical protein